MGRIFLEGYRGEDEEEQKSENRKGDGKKDERSCLSGPRPAVVHQAADQDVAQDDEDDGDDREQGEIGARQAEDIGHVAVEVGAENRIGEKGEGGPDEVA